MSKTSAVSAFLHKLWVGNGPIVPHHVGAPLPQTPVKAEAGYHMPPDEPIDIPVYKFIGKLNIHMTDGTSIGYHRELKEGETADTYEAFAKGSCGHVGPTAYRIRSTTLNTAKDTRWFGTAQSDA